MVIVLRHTAVAAHWHGRCYGVSDAGLSAEGMEAARRLAEAVDCAGVMRLQASPLRRARYLGGLLSRRLDLPLEIVPALRERHFGSWEGRSWDAIHAAEGSSMMGMIDAPASFRPGGGETTMELADRVMAWFGGLPSGVGVVVVTHGGPVAALRGCLGGRAVSEWLSLVPALGEVVRLG